MSTSGDMADPSGARPTQPPTADTLAGDRRAAREIARSIAAAGLRIARPWPTVNSGGSSARSARADCSARRRSQVAIAAAGEQNPVKQRCPASCRLVSGPSSCCPMPWTATTRAIHTFTFGPEQSALRP